MTQPKPAACGVCESLAAPNLYEDDLWCVREAEPAGVPAGEVPVDRAEVARISEAYRRALAAAPRPW